MSQHGQRPDWCGWVIRRLATSSAGRSDLRLPGGGPTFDSTGLAPHEALAYRTLLQAPAASAADLAGQLGMSMTQVRGSLRRLEARGLVGRLPGAAQRYRAAAPEDVFGPALRRRRAALRGLRADVGRLTDEYRGARHHHDRRGRVELLEGDGADHVAAVAAAARAEISVVLAEPYAVSWLVAGMSGGARPGLARRAMCGRDLLEATELASQVGSAAGRGSRIAVADRPRSSMLIVDRSIALLPVTYGGQSAPRQGVPGPGVPAGSADGPACLLVVGGGLPEALAAGFDRDWAVAQPVPVAGGRAGLPLVPGEADLRLLALLLEGLTDEAIAGKLAVGTRTVQRRVRELIDSVDARTRLQLIWQATRRGWI